MRYFENKFNDYTPGSVVEIDNIKWIEQILHIVESIIEGFPAVHENSDGGLYVGTAGIGYMFYCLAQNEAFGSKCSTFLDRAYFYSIASLEQGNKPRQDDASFILGGAGERALRVLVFEAKGDSKNAKEFADKYSELSSRLKGGDSLGYGSDELFVGRAGYICGAVNLNKKLNKQVIKEHFINSLCEDTLESGRRRASKYPDVPLMYSYYNTEYLGAAHGMSSILQMLLCVPEFIKSNCENEELVRAGVDFMLSLEQENYNYPPAMDEVKQRSGSHMKQRSRPDKEELVHWCHGAPGVIYMLARAYLFWKDDKYLQACLRCGELTWHRGLLKKGPGICHGVAGSGYVFLLLYRLTGDKKHLYRALKFAEFIFFSEFQKARIPDSPYSLYEGWAGTVCFLADLLQPDKAEFPFFNVFVD